MKVKTNWVPSAFTMANLFCGYYSVLLSSSDRFIPAAWLIVAAAVLDALDGKIARFAKVDSRFGVEYDSLADVISFGFAPSFLIYRSVFIQWGAMGIFISVAPLAFGSIRLARFNISLKSRDKEYFEGLPIPAAAVSIATFLVFNFHFWGYLRWSKVYLFLVIALSVLMVTGIRYETFPSFSLQAGAQNRNKILVVIAGIMAVIFFPQEAFFPLAIFYVAYGPLRFTWTIIRGDHSDRKQKMKDTDP